MKLNPQWLEEVNRNLSEICDSDFAPSELVHDLTFALSLIEHQAKMLERCREFYSKDRSSFERKAFLAELEKEGV